VLWRKKCALWGIPRNLQLLDRCWKTFIAIGDLWAEFMARYRRVAVDLPFVIAKFLEYLLLRARESGAMVTLPRADGGLQPLCGVYRRGFADVAERSLRDGKNKIDPLFKRVETCVIAEDELLRAGFSVEMFRNLNTPEEFERARSSRFE
jgi:molybdopterin-guanine dinucleotide biosynthesis protein A